jgi:hypothetical protein
VTLETGDVVVIRANFRGGDDPQYVYIVQEMRADGVAVIVPLVGQTEFLSVQANTLQKIP